MRKKDGYILVYVMFVLVFLCLAAVAVCSSALDNLTAQNDAADRMEQRLTADSNVEKFMATVSKGGTGNGNYDFTVVQNSFAATITAYAGNMSIDAGEPVWSWSGSGNQYNCAVTVQAEAGSVRVDATVDFLVTFECSQVPNPDYNAETNPDVAQYLDYWKISNVTSKYISYATGNVDSEGGGTE